MNDNDLRKRLNELRLELAKERSQIAIGGSPSNPGRVREIKKDIARILTELKRR
jgi:large subunit ribosomal protein L29